MRFIQKDAEEKKTSFNPRPYFRLFINWLLDLTTLEPVSDGANLQVWFMDIFFDIVVAILVVVVASIFVLNLLCTLRF